MAQPQGRPRVPDALVMRESEDGTEWEVRTIAADRVPVYLEAGAGWQLLISEPDVRSASRSFNPPRRR